MFEKSLEEELEAKRRASVECLGMTFENDEKRREYFLEKLREKLKDPEFRKIEGFPIGEDEDILALSDTAVQARFAEELAPTSNRSRKAPHRATGAPCGESF
jgi:hypothetical protein